MNGNIGGNSDLPTTGMIDRTKGAPRRVLIVDAYPLVRHGLHTLLMTMGWTSVIGEADSGQRAIEAVRKERWDLVILDFRLSDWTGLNVLREIKLECPSLPVLIFSLHPKNRYAVWALKAGASAYVDKASPMKELITVIEKVMAGQVVEPTSTEKPLGGVLMNRTAAPVFRGLSDREFDVVCRLARGQTVKRIASELSISAKTVSSYRARMLDKLHLRTTADLVRYALGFHLVKNRDL